MASAEREPITGIWGRSPQRSPGAEPLVRGSGELKAFRPSDVQQTQQICTLGPLQYFQFKASYSNLNPRKYNWKVEDKGMHPPPAPLEPKCVWQECWRQPKQHHTRRLLLWWSQQKKDVNDVNVQYDNSQSGHGPQGGGAWPDGSHLDPPLCLCAAACAEGVSPFVNDDKFSVIRTASTTIITT